MTSSINSTSLSFPAWPYHDETDIETTTSEEATPSNNLDWTLPKLVELPKILVSPAEEATPLNWTPKLVELPKISASPAVGKTKRLGDNLSDRVAKKPKTLEKSNAGESIEINPQKPMPKKPPLLRDTRSVGSILSLAGISELTNVPSLKRPTEDQTDQVSKKRKIENDGKIDLNNLLGKIATDPLSIETINLSNHGIFSLKFIETCTSLQRLNVSGTQVATLEGVPAKNLKTLFMNDCLYLKSFNCLPFADTIKKLSLRNCVNLTEIVLGECPLLEEVDLTGSKNLTTLRPFERCTQLKKLHLGGNVGISSKEIQHLKECTELTIHINDLQITYKEIFEKSNRKFDVAFKTFMPKKPA